MRNVLTLATAALVLTGCSGGSDKASDSGDKPADSVRAKKTFDAINVKPGLWETKTTFKTVDAKSLPETAKRQMMAAMGDGITVKNCLSQEQAEKPGAEFFGSPDSSNCAVGSLAVSGDRMTVKLSCKPDDKTVITSSMTGRFSANTYGMDVQQKTSGTPMGDLITTGKINGKRLGDCPGVDAEQVKL